MLHQTQFLIIEPRDSPYYVQFIPSEQGELYCEAVSNEYLDDEDRLAGDAELELIGLGWSSAEPNFKQLWDEPIPFNEVAERMARTLIEVFGARGLDDVTFTYGDRTPPEPGPGPA